MTNVTLVNETEFHVVAVGPVQVGSGSGSGGIASELISVWNNGSPEIVFDAVGEGVTVDAS